MAEESRHRMNGGERSSAHSTGTRSDRADGSVTVEAQALLPMIWADPQHMPEQLAFFAVRRFGPRAATAVARRRERDPQAGADELGHDAIAHGTRMTIVEGAALGGPFIVLMPVSFVAALLSQATMVLELAAVAGHDPCSERRVADILVLQDVYPSTEAARRSLIEVSRHPEGGHGRLPRRTRWSLLVRMAAVLGLTGGEKPSRVRRLLSSTMIGALFLVGMVLPLIWVPALAVLYRQSTLRLGDKAVQYYSPGATGDRLRHRRPFTRLPRATGIAVILRFLALTLLPFLAATGIVLAGVRLTGGFWGTALIALVLLSLLLGGLWLLHRRSLTTGRRQRHTL
ncbi:hypothetical protein ACGFOU_00345 [Streptomyces sp. NPDC048595]|uniref:hypothetical protein n=1 Tax=Streptomyces sp. NPDC048595 TaxID=3365576 RepID=UPI003712611B